MGWGKVSERERRCWWIGRLSIVAKSPVVQKIMLFVSIHEGEDKGSADHVGLP